MNRIPGNFSLRAHILWYIRTVSRSTGCVLSVVCSSHFTYYVCAKPYADTTINLPFICMIFSPLGPCLTRRLSLMRILHLARATCTAGIIFCVLFRVANTPTCTCLQFPWRTFHSDVEKFWLQCLCAMENIYNNNNNNSTLPRTVNTKRKNNQNLSPTRTRRENDAVVMLLCTVANVPDPVTTRYYIFVPLSLEGGHIRDCGSVGGE